MSYSVFYTNKVESIVVKTFDNLIDALKFVSEETKDLVNYICGVGFDENDKCGQFRYEVCPEDDPLETLYTTPCFWEK